MNNKKIAIRTQNELAERQSALTNIFLIMTLLEEKTGYMRKKTPETEKYVHIALVIVTCGGEN